MRSGLHKLWCDDEGTQWRCRQYYEGCVRSLPPFESIRELTSPRGLVYQRLQKLLFHLALQHTIVLFCDFKNRFTVADEDQK